MSHRKIPRPYYEQTGTPSSSNHPGAAEDADAAGGPSSTIANYFDRVRSAVEQFEIPLRSIRASNFGDPHQKIIKIRTEGNSEFLFIEFLRYEKARQNFETAMRKLYPAS
ncbi:hypothetical protein OIU85_007721 [Salix viminalis]|uniref:Uncharacterized protein n=1 Tax=Salix viminalis TaxID=40686 RepID=A0A9Q0P9E0_SALVM|nr:hypothetical protein OIU85_007721 [Salix viminalis]